MQTIGKIDRHRSRRPFLLVVDDDASIRATLQELFTSLDYEVATAKDGAEALDQMARRRADVVLTDIFMGGTDGFELISTIRSKHRETRVAAMSGGHAEYDALTFADRLGADVVIDKPFRGPQVVETVDRLIRGYRRIPL